MNRIYLNILFLLILVAAVTSCKKDDPKFDNTKMVSIYDVTYDENAEITTAFAQFRNGETSEVLELHQEAKLRYNGDTMKYVEDISAYVVQYFGGQIVTGSFSLTLETGEVYLNQSPISEPIFFEPTLDTIPQFEPFTVLWLGAPLGEDQRVEMILSEEKFSQTVVGSNTLLLDDAVLRKINIGVIPAYMERTIRLPLTEGTAAGGQITAKYRAKDATVTLIP